MTREKINFDDETMNDLWNGVYSTNSSVEIKGDTYTQIAVINTSEKSDGESHDYIVQRKSDGKYFKFNVWDAGSHNGNIFSDGDDSLTEVFPKTITKTIYE
jgi:hypothetical protein